MTRSAGRPASLALLVALGSAAPVAAQAPDPRTELDALARALAKAVAQVSRPVAWTLVPEADAALGYRVAGLGAIFVVGPRALPAETTALPADAAPGLPRVIRVVEQTLLQAESPETRARLQKTLDGLRRQQQELVARAAAQESGRAALQRLGEERLARRAREAAQGVAVDRRQRVQDAAAAEAALRSFEAQAAAFQREAQAARQAAESALGEVAQEMRERLGGAQTLAGPGEAPPALPAFVPPPPWRFWGDLEPPLEQRPAATVVGDVRDAVTGVLDARGGSLRILAPQELVLVTVDFVPQGGLRVQLRPERTLIVRVRKQALEERAAGRLSSEALRARIEYQEY